MNLKDAIKLIKTNKIANENTQELLEAFTDDSNAKNIDYLSKVVDKIQNNISESNYNLVLNILDRYEENVDSDCLTKFNIYYVKAHIFLNCSDYYHTIDYIYKMFSLDGLDYKYEYYGDVFLVNVLFNMGDYKDALIQNERILKGKYFKKLKDDYKLVTYFNECLIYIALDNFEEAQNYYNICKNILNSMDSDRYNQIQQMNRFYAIAKFSNRFSLQYVEKSLNEYIKFIYDMDIELLIQNFEIHVLVLESLLQLKRTKEVYKICHYLIDERGLNQNNIDIYRLLLKAIDKNLNLEEYISVLEKYNNSLELSNKKRNAREILYYDKTDKFFQMNKKFNQLEIDFNHDSLTKLLSRASFEKVLNSKDYFALLYFDVNDLKRINDTHGHKYGDLYLKEFADNLSLSIKGDIYRVGGDEFIAIVYDENEEEIIKSVKKLDTLPLFDTTDNHKFSCGIFFNYDKNVDIKTSEIYADEALYEAKSNSNTIFSIYKRKSM